MRVDQRGEDTTVDGPTGLLQLVSEPELQPAVVDANLGDLETDELDEQRLVPTSVSAPQRSAAIVEGFVDCLLYTSPSPRDPE